MKRDSIRFDRATLFQVAREIISLKCGKQRHNCLKRILCCLERASRHRDMQMIVCHKENFAEILEGGFNIGLIGFCTVLQCFLDHKEQLLTVKHWPIQLYYSIRKICGEKTADESPLNFEVEISQPSGHHRVHCSTQPYR